METLDDLVCQRGIVKGRLTRFTTHVKKQTINSLNDKTIIELQTRLDKAETCFNEFEQIQEKIEKIYGDENLDEQLLERELYENLYYDTTALAKSLINEHQKQNCVAVPSVNLNSTVPQSQSLTNVKLPTITLPTFDGSYENWHNFRDIFTTLVHDNAAIDNIQKFYYLRMYLDKQASQVIDSLEVTKDNYNTAWQLLNNRYENKRLTVHNHVNALFTLPVLLKESHKSLRELLDKLLKHLRALNNLKEPTDNWDTLIIYLISSKLDPASKREWETSISDKTEVPNLDEFTKFLTHRCQLLETLNPQQNIHTKQTIVKTKLTSLAISNNQMCHFCNKTEHNIYHCEAFLKLTPQERIKHIKQGHLCLNCLRKGHQINQCRSMSSCKYCHRKHNSLIHLSYENKSSTVTVTPTIKQTENELNKTQPNKNTVESYVNNHSLSQSHPQHILLATACVYINDIYGNQHQCRILLDSGSQANFITKALQSKLSLPLTKINSVITGVNQSSSNISHKTQIEIQSRVNSYKTTLQCLVIHKITENMPSQSFSIESLKIPQNLVLADQNFNYENQIDILLGANIFWELLCVGQIKLGNHCPILQKTKFGWILSGPLSNNVFNNQPNKSHCGLVNTLEIDLEKFWDINDYCETNVFTKEEQYCESHFNNTTKRSESGRFIVSVPLKQDRATLGESREIALKRLYSLEKRLQHDPELKQNYSNFLKEYLALDHMILIKEDNDANNISKFYLPHHAVFKASSTSTKTRVVFDASCKSNNGISLNDIQCVGPVIQNDLFTILIRFRRHKYVLTADIEKMYRQILVTKDDTHLQRIFWRQEPSHPVQCYELQTVTYGTASAPYLATKCLFQLSEDNQSAFPDACEIIKKDFYVDDMLSGANSIENLQQLKHEVTNILLSAGFKLTKWLSNINLDIKDSVSQNANLSFEKNHETKMLGVNWNAYSDSFTYTIKNNITNKHITKRTILSAASQIFDPLGLLNPVTMRCKLIIQQLWQYNLSWDESIPTDLHTKWLQFYNELKILNNLEVPRCVLISESSDIQLHGFADASESAFGACVYIRSKDQFQNTYQVRLLCAKSRVAPLRQLTIPRLELCAAALLSKLMYKLINTLDIKFSAYYYWSDSKITLCWIAAPCQKWQTFVANRVATIQKTSDISNWHHINSKDNPADLLSRGIKTQHLFSPSGIWWNGPEWLSQEQHYWPNETPEIEEHNLPEIRNTKVTLTICFDFNLFTKYSSLTKLIRITAWILRFYHNSKNSPKLLDPCLSVKEMEFALLALVKLAQTQMFQSDIKQLNANTSRYNGKLVALDPFLDKNNILRVGGRIHLAPFSYDKRHPIILPKDHPLTTMIITNEHYKNLHCGNQTLLAIIRERFWPISGKNQIKKVLRNCTVCFRVNPKAELYKMGNLPISRLKPSPPFYNCGLDYAGPFLLKDKRTRGNKSIKCYISSC